MLCRTATTLAPPAIPTNKGRKKADLILDEFLQSTLAERPLPVPITAPDGIGRRAASGTTVLFRNQLVKNDEEREGWGFPISR